MEMEKYKGEEFRNQVLSNLKEFVKANFVSLNGMEIVLAPYQEEFIKAVLERKYRRYVVLASTRCGKTEATAVSALLSALCYDGEEVVVVSDSYAHAQNMFERIRGYFLANNKLSALVDWKKGFRREEINLLNGSVLRCISAGNPAAPLGYGATVLIIDEAEEIPDVVYRTRIRRMVVGRAGRSKPFLIALGTPHKVNFLYNLWNETGEDVWKRRVTWKEGVAAGILDEEEVMYQKTIMSEAEFKVWFEAEWVSMEALLFDSRRVLEVSRIKSPLRKREEGWLYFAGLDVARFGEDENAFVIVRIPAGVSYEADEARIEMVNYWRRAKKSMTDVEGWALNLCEKWNPELLVVEEIGLGAGVFDHLKEKLGEDKIAGVVTVGQERTHLYLNLNQMIEEGKIVLLDDEALRMQFSSFEVKYDSVGRIMVKKKQGRRDDIVDALAFALWGCKKATEAGGRIAVLEGAGMI